MPENFLAVAISKPNRAKEKEFLKICREMFDYLGTQGYSRDRLYRDTKSKEYINLRLWTSTEEAMTAHKDPKVRDFWKRLGKVSKIVKIHEVLEEIKLPNAGS